MKLPHSLTLIICLVFVLLISIYSYKYNSVQHSITIINLDKTGKSSYRWSKLSTAALTCHTNPNNSKTHISRPLENRSIDINPTELTKAVLIIVQIRCHGERSVLFPPLCTCSPSLSSSADPVIVYILPPRPDRCTTYAPIVRMLQLMT